MFRTANETQQDTLARFLKAMDAKHPVTITYTKADGTQTVRTIEAYDVHTTKAGDIVIKAMDRESGESRNWRLDRIQAYTVHRTAFVLPEPEPANELGLRVTVNRPTTVVAREMAREDADYWNDRYDFDPEFDAA
ncbi:WYL domain-containing protein [Streptomyces lavendulae]|uniref:WYL domain-containing protein n=1 Tax=Streptomyces lavendulae TaxID=1914 RepID=UPI0033F0F624